MCILCSLQDSLEWKEAAKTVAPPPTRQNYESTNMWEYKPAWCQPWSILTTGISAVLIVNTISHKSALWTSVIAIPVLIWWFLFLYLVPQEFKEYVQQQNANK